MGTGNPIQTTKQHHAQSKCFDYRRIGKQIRGRLFEIYERPLTPLNI